MAHCVISAILDTDVDAMVPACIVHTAHAPCMHDGEPASPAPLHAFNCLQREDAIRMWQIRTHRQRPLIIHDEQRVPDPEDHVIKDEIRPCPCGAEVLAAEAPGGPAMRAIRTLVAGTVLSAAAVAGLARLDPGPAHLPPMSFRHPWAAYLALAAAPFGNGLELFALVAFIFAMCIFVAGWREARRPDLRRKP